MILDEDGKTMADVPWRKLAVLDESGEVQATPDREGIEDLLKSSISAREDEKTKQGWWFVQRKALHKGLL